MGEKVGEDSMIIGIIGGGASGMAAALTAAEDPGNQVVVLERQARVGRKLQATGNGRCNLTNLNMTSEHYHGDDAAFSQAALHDFTVEQTLEWFCRLGLYTVAEPSGRVYPYSDQANSVVDVLRFALQQPNIRLELGYEVTKVRKKEEKFLIEGSGEPVSCDRLIVACGGLAGTKLGGSMAGYKLLRSFGHHATRLRPTLVQLKSPWTGAAALKGVRANCRAEILHDGTVTAESTGELQWTEYGLSGPVIFEVSRDVCQTPGQWSCRLDFLPDVTEEELTAELLRRREHDRTAEDLLTGILHNRLGRVITQSVGLKGQRHLSELSDWDLQQVAAAVKAFEVEISEPLGMDSAQVTAGGVCTDEFIRDTMQSRLVPGLYACGEVLDVDGDCGGYNLQWAWSSGRMAGAHAGKEPK